MSLLVGYLASLSVGISLGLLGAGGSILMVPILVYLFGISPVQATGYSLFVVGMTALIGMVQYFWRREVRIRIAVLFALPSFGGVFLARRVLLPRLPARIATLGDFVLTRDALVMAVFGLVMVLASWAMLRPKRQDHRRPKGPQRLSVRGIGVVVANGFGVGALSGFVGAGGGFLIIPALVVLLGLSMKEAVGTSLMIIAANSLFGFFGDLRDSAALEWGFLLLVTGLSILGIVIGTILGRQISEARLKPAFGVFVLVLGAWILARQFLGP